MTMKYAVILILSSARGIYIPRDFICDDYNEIALEHCKAWGLNESNIECWQDAANPDSEFYWEAWEWILSNAEYKAGNGDKYRLYQDGDLWGYTAFATEPMKHDQRGILNGYKLWTPRPANKRRMVKRNEILDHRPGWVGSI